MEDKECAGWTTSTSGLVYQVSLLHRQRQKMLDVTDSSMQPTVEKRRRRDDNYDT